MSELARENQELSSINLLPSFCEQLIIDHAQHRAGQLTMHRFAKEFALQYGEEHPLLGKEAVLSTVRSMMGTELELTASRTVGIRDPQKREFPEEFKETAMWLIEEMSPIDSN